MAAQRFTIITFPFPYKSFVFLFARVSTTKKKNEKNRKRKYLLIIFLTNTPIKLYVRVYISIPKPHGSCCAVIAARNSQIHKYSPRSNCNDVVTVTLNAYLFYPVVEWWQILFGRSRIVRAIRHCNISTDTRRVSCSGKCHSVVTFSSGRIKTIFIGQRSRNDR